MSLTESLRSYGSPPTGVESPMQSDEPRRVPLPALAELEEIVECSLTHADNTQQRMVYDEFIRLQAVAIDLERSSWTIAQ